MVKGFRRDRRGFRAYVKVGTEQRFKRFPVGTKLKEINDWRDETRVALRKMLPDKAAPGSLESDAQRDLAQVSAMPTIWQRADHLAKWINELGANTRRASLTAESLRAVMQRWRAEGLAPATCNKRRTSLMHLFTLL